MHRPYPYVGFAVRASCEPWLVGLELLSEEEEADLEVTLQNKTQHLVLGRVHICVQTTTRGSLLRRSRESTQPCPAVCYSSLETTVSSAISPRHFFSPTIFKYQLHPNGSTSRSVDHYLSRRSCQLHISSTSHKSISACPNHDSWSAIDQIVTALSDIFTY